MWFRTLFLVLAAASLMFGFDALAAKGQPDPWQMGFQDAASPVMEEVHDFHRMVLYIISGIVIFVMLLMTVIFVRFNKRANPTPRKFSHNTALEIVWTVIPVIILIVIALPSIKLLKLQNDSTDADLTLKVTGHSWFWSYEYPDYGIAFDSFINRDEDAEPRLLDTTDSVVVPVGEKVRLLVTSGPNDVIHSWALPSFGVKMDAVPGRINETWFTATSEGRYFGQCSELCGTNHAFMPIEIEVVSRDEFETWVEAQGGTLPGGADDGSNETAAAGRPADAEAVVARNDTDE